MPGKISREWERRCVRVMAGLWEERYWIGMQMQMDKAHLKPGKGMGSHGKDSKTLIERSSISRKEFPAL